MKKILSRVLFITLILSLTLLALGATSTGRGCNCGMLTSFFQSCNPPEKPYEQEEDFIYFGEFPQTIKADSVEITEVQDGRGYYLGSDNFYYAKVEAIPYVGGYEFTTGEKITIGREYYFKVEPIKWRILSEEDGNAFILCENVLINKQYNSSYDNNYANSDIRWWLNYEFYYVAFSDQEREIIITTNVDNSAQTTYTPDYNENACENTFDKIFLLSYQETLNTDFGFSSDYESDTARAKSTTDFARASGAKIDTSDSLYGKGFWWLRSPTSYYKSNVASVESNGYAVGNYYYAEYFHVNINHYGVVPAMNIKL